MPKRGFVFFWSDSDAFGQLRLLPLVSAFPVVAALADAGAEGIGVKLSVSSVPVSSSISYDPCCKAGTAPLDNRRIIMFSKSVPIASLSFFFILYVTSTSLLFDRGLADVVLLLRRACAFLFGAPLAADPPGLLLSLNQNVYRRCSFSIFWCL
jgi:hypothetical protein